MLVFQHPAKVRVDGRIERPRHMLTNTFIHIQIDLRYILKSMGFKGGLKGCEKQLGMDRGDLAGVDGLLAVYL
jgi:uncharacterized protein YprB with RNaseH-like and TPR domain